MSKHHTVQIIIFVIYILVITAIMIWEGVGIDPSRYVFVLFLPALLLKKTRYFFLDWLPFVFWILSYDFLRGLAGILEPRANFLAAINFDKWLFGGQIPTVWLQQHLYTPGGLHWYDFMATMFYFLHFALPFGFGFIIWMFSRNHFHKFVAGFILSSYAGWLTFIAFPAAPPWLAHNNGLLPGVTKIVDQVIPFFPEKLHLPSIYHSFDANTVAAIPSIHTAYPLLVTLFAVEFFGAWGWLFLLYVLGLSFSLIYTGEHYFLDVILGYLYAILFYFVTKLIWKYHPRITNLAKKLILR